MQQIDFLQTRLTGPGIQDSPQRVEVQIRAFSIRIPLGEEELATVRRQGEHPPVNLPAARQRALGGTAAADHPHIAIGHVH